MRTDELRKELEELSSAPTSDTSDVLDAVYRRARRGHQRVVAAALIAIVVMLGGVGIVISRHSDHKLGITTRPPASLVAPMAVRPDAVVTPPGGASWSELGRIEVALAASNAVVRYSRLETFDPTPTTQGPSCSLPFRWIVDLAPASGVSDLQHSIPYDVTVQITAKAEAAQPRLSSALRARNEVEVFMNVSASDAQIAKVRQAIDRLSGVTHVAYLDRAAAYAEFKRIFANSPDLYKEIGPGDLPPSFVLDVSPAFDAHRLQGLQALPGVATIADHRSLFGGPGVPLSAIPLSGELRSQVDASCVRK
jgi:hypothetical protein